ncbi:OsmC family protein [Parabacteroides bouchesdurhonensis]|uniref:OsmC family protein n=1 Tax=Parabacteroides bouchesdurhonensis TaxID=1936995 RepID=UPI000C8482F5|nr:OsmC family protein [Parabacteroides bouchesdurhonensis]
MSVKITLKWKKDSTFETELNGHPITIDTSIENGGNDEGPRPKALMLIALAGCTGMDVAPLFRKMRIHFDNLSIDVTAETSDGIPMVYTAFQVTYHVTADPADSNKIIKAVRLSQEKYCGVTLMMKKIAPVTWQIILNNTLLNLNEENK